MNNLTKFKLPADSSLFIKNKSFVSIVGPSGYRLKKRQTRIHKKIF